MEKKPTTAEQKLPTIYYLTCIVFFILIGFVSFLVYDYYVKRLNVNEQIIKHNITLEESKDYDLEFLND